MGTLKTGKRAEDIVVDYLGKTGYEILTTNYYIYMVGEIDIIAVKNDEILAIEVKGRSKSNDFTGMEGLVTQSKLNKIRKTFSLYLDSAGHDYENCKIVLAFVQLSSNPIYNRILFKTLN